jgi:hypothetical protein
MSERSSSRVSNSLAERASSSSRGGSTFSFSSLSTTSTCCFSESPSAYSVAFVSPALIPWSTCSISSTSLPDPSSTT